MVEALCEAEAAGDVAAAVPAALGDATAAGVVLAAAAGLMLAAGVVAAGLAVVLAVAAGLDVAFVFGVNAAVALGDALEVVVGAFESLLFRREFFVASGVAVAAGVFSALAFGSAADGFFLFDFLSVFVVGGVGTGVVADGSVAVDSFTAEVSVFGAFVTGFSARGFFSGGACFLDGACDASGVDSWAIMAPASAIEATIIKVVIFFMLLFVWS